MSTHEVPVVRITEILPHPNADTLSLIPIFGWQVIVKTGDFKVGDLAIYIPPDYMVPTTHPSFSFLARPERTHERITIRKFRGLISQGLLIPPSPDLNPIGEGSNVAADLGIFRYEPPVGKKGRIGGAGGSLGDAPDGPQPSLPYVPKFDVESFQRYHKLIEEGEAVVITEKIHGANARYCYGPTPLRDGDGITRDFFIGSRNRWLKPDTSNVWTRAASTTPGILEWCKANPDYILYGEVYGQVQDLRYNTGPDEVKFAAFAAISGLTGQYMPFTELFDSLAWYSVPHAPVLYRGPFSRSFTADLAERDSTLAPGQLSEGCVILAIPERNHPNLGRLVLKLVSNRYLASGH